MVPPGVTVAEPSVLLMERSAIGVRVSVSVAELSTRFGSAPVDGIATESTLARLPFFLFNETATTENVTPWPAAMSTSVEMSPVPDACAHDEPVVAVHVHDVIVAPVGAASETFAPTTSEGPWFVTTTL